MSEQHSTPSDPRHDDFRSRYNELFEAELASIQVQARRQPEQPSDWMRGQMAQHEQWTQEMRMEPAPSDRIDEARSAIESIEPSEVRYAPVAPDALLDDYFEHTVTNAEAREPLPDDIISVGVHPGMVEYDVLVRAGIPEDRIRSGSMTREELTRAGYFFNNRLGGGEKGIFEVEIPGTENSETLDLTGRALLTREEVTAVYVYQQNNPDTYGLHGLTVEEVRRDMVRFLLAATHTPEFGGNGVFAAAAFPSSPDWQYVGDSGDWEMVDDYMRRLEEEYRRTHQPSDNPHKDRIAVQEYIVKTHMPDLYEWEDNPRDLGQRDLRGHTVTSISQRVHKLKGQPSPFLDQGFIYSSNPDTLVETSIGQRRVNMGSLHVLGGHPDYPGLSEMGGQRDQVYMATGEYVESLYPRTSDDAKAARRQAVAALQRRNYEELTNAAQERVIALAHAAQTKGVGQPWGAESYSPPAEADDTWL